MIKKLSTFYADADNIRTSFRDIIVMGNPVTSDKVKAVS
jgi:hypothetical protein